MKDIYYGFDDHGNIVDEFYGTYEEAIEYYNTPFVSNKYVVYFDTLE